MKNFKKAIAILLAVLMVAFSVPFTALAQDSYDDVYLKVMITPYNSATEYGFKSATTAKVLDPSNIKFSDLGDDHKIAVYILTQGLDDVGTASMAWFYDNTVLTCDSILEKPSTGVTSGIVPSNNDMTSIDDTMACIGFSISDGTSLASLQTSTYDGGTVDGTVWGVFEFTVLEDGANVEWTNFTDDEPYGFDYWDMTFLDLAYPAGYNDYAGEDFDEFQFGYVYPASAPSTDVTYTFIDTTTTTVAAGADAPANTTPTAWADNSNGTHSRTVYSWVQDSDTAFHEEGTTETANCDSNTIVTPAQDYIHTADTLQNGITAVTACSVCGGNQQGGEVTVAEHTYTDVVTAATCIAPGYTTHTCTCGKEVVDTYTAIDTTNHADGCVLVNDEAVAATCVATGLTAGSHYSLCGTVNVAQETTPIDTVNGHDYQVSASTGATCITPGAVTYTCSLCNDSYTVTGALDPNNHEGALTTDEAVAATCVATGLTAGSHWSCCGVVVEAQEVTEINADNHVGTVALDESTVVVANCTTGGYTGDTKCSECGNVVTAGTATAVDPANHTGNLVTDEAVAATRATSGLTEGSHWDCCGTIEVAQEVIPALGVQITVENGDNVKINGAAYTGVTTVTYGAAYTLSTDADNFEAWMMGDKIVSTSATYTTAAFADTTYTAVFASDTTGTVTFVDKFNNVLATYTAEEAAAWDAIPEIASPFAGYTVVADGYSMTLEQIKAATGDVTVTAKYEKVDNTYTVTATGATITVNGTDYTDSADVTGYDVPVTVTADGATAWTVNGKEVGFGASYTFYVTSDVTISFTTADVVVAPVVTAVNGNGDVQSDGVKVRFLASRDIPNNYKVVESGYLYGKEIEADDLVLENVGTVPAGAGSKVFNYKNSNTANVGQFAFTFGVSAQTTASARAYIIVSLNGVNEVYYADAQIYNY